MKTYLTSTEFSKLFFEQFKQKMQNYNRAESTSDRIIWHMFSEYEKEIKETLEGSMWGVDEYTGESAIDVIGHSFHKSFRQTDVIPAKHIDGIVWSCMQDAPIFWKCMEKACKILTSEDAAEIYKDEEGAR
jgi:hypothetical protein